MGGRFGPSPAAILAERLDAALGDAGATRTLLRATLVSARRAAFPEEPRELLAIVRAHLVPALIEEIGARAVAVLLQELDDDLAERASIVPPARYSIAPAPNDALVQSDTYLRPRVVLHDPDRFARAALARGLVARGCDVSVIDDPLEIADRAFYVAIVDLESNAAASIVEALRRANPRTRVIGRTRGSSLDAEDVLRRAGLHDYHVVPRSMRDNELSTLVRRLASG